MEIQVLETIKDVLDRFSRATDKIDKLSLNNASSNVTMPQNDNSHIVLVFTICLVVSVACVVTLSVINVMQNRTITQIQADQREIIRKYDRMQDHLSAIYMMAPQLKPEDEKK